MTACEVANKTVQVGAVLMNPAKTVGGLEGKKNPSLENRRRASKRKRYRFKNPFSLRHPLFFQGNKKKW